MKSKLLNIIGGSLIFLSSFNPTYAEEDKKVLNLDPFRVEIIGNRMGDADSEKLFRYAEYLYKNKRYNDALPYLEKIKEYSRSNIVDDAIYLLGGIYLSRHPHFDGDYDNVMILYEQMPFTHPDGNIIMDGHLKITLEQLLNEFIRINNYPHTTWTFNILENYPGIREDYIRVNKIKVENFLKKDISDISLHHAKYNVNDYFVLSAGARFELFKMLAKDFHFFDSVKMSHLINELKKQDTLSPEGYRNPISGKGLIEEEQDPKKYFEGWRALKIGYREGTTLEDFLKDIGIKDPIKWWKTLQ